MNFNAKLFIGELDLLLNQFISGLNEVEHSNKSDSLIPEEIKGASKSIKFDLTLLEADYMDNSKEYTHDDALKFYNETVKIVRQHEVKLMEQPGFFNELLAHINQFIEKLTGYKDLLPTEKSVFGESKTIVAAKDSLLSHKNNFFKGLKVEAKKEDDEAENDDGSNLTQRL